MSRVFLSLVVAALLAASRVVNGGPPIDTSALGQQVQAKVSDDQVVITRNQMQIVYESMVRTEKRTRLVEVDGEKKEEEFTVEVPVTISKCVPITYQQAVQLDQVQAFDMQGKRVAGDQLADALKEERTILLATRKVPRYYLTIYKPDTLLLVIEPQMVHGAPVPLGPALPAPGVAPRFDAPRTLPAPVPVPGDPPKIEAPRVLPAPTAPVPGEAPPKPDAALKPAAPRTLPAPAAPVPPDAPRTLPAPAVPAAPGGVAPLAATASDEPQVSMARIVDDKVGLRRYVKDVSSETALREEVVDGVKKLAPVAIEVETITDIERKYPQNLLKIYRADKKPLAEDEIAKLKETERCVLVSSDGKEVDPKYLKIIKPEALIVVAPTTPNASQLLAPFRATAPVLVPAPTPLPVPMPPDP